MKLIMRTEASVAVVYNRGRPSMVELGPDGWRLSAEGARELARKLTEAADQIDAEITQPGGDGADDQP